MGMPCDTAMVPQVQLENGHMTPPTLPDNPMRSHAHVGGQQRSEGMAWAGMQGLDGRRGEAFASLGSQSYNPAQRQQFLQPLSMHNTVTSGMPLPEQALPEHRLDLGSLESAQFAGNGLGGRAGALASLNSATGNAICRTALFNQPNGRTAARNIVLKVAPTSAASPGPANRGSKALAVDMETMPSAESQKAPEPPPAAAAYAPQQPSGVATRGLRQGARRNPPRYSDFTDDLSDTDSQELSYDEDEDLGAFSEEEDNSSRRLGLRSRGSSLQSADASQFFSAMSGGADSGGGGARRGGVAPKRPRSKTLLCEQDPEAPGLTLDQRRKIRRWCPVTVLIVSLKHSSL